MPVAGVVAVAGTTVRRTWRVGAGFAPRPTPPPTTPPGVGDPTRLASADRNRPIVTHRVRRPDHRRRRGRARGAGRRSATMDTPALSCCSYALREMRQQIVKRGCEREGYRRDSRVGITDSCCPATHFAPNLALPLRKCYLVCCRRSTPPGTVGAGADRRPIAARRAGDPGTWGESATAVGATSVPNPSANPVGGRRKGTL